MSKEADRLRLAVLAMGRAAGSGHMGGSLSCAEILNVLYGRVLRVDPARPDWRERDRFVLSCINQKIMTPKHFQTQENGAVLLTDEGRRAFLGGWQTRKQETITHPFLNEKLPWGLVPYVQALLLARTLRGDMELYPPFFWK